MYPLYTLVHNSISSILWHNVIVINLKNINVINFYLVTFNVVVDNV